jgi:hypothetical protein
MTPEEYQRIKEKEKEHLRALKQLKQTARVLERQRSINRALQDMEAGAQQARETHEELLDRLTLETAMNEARLEVALDAVEEAAPASSPEALEAELQVARARQLIDTLKRQAAAADPAAASEHEADKTIGRMR